MELRLISIGFIKNDVIGKYIRHTPTNIVIEVNSIEYKFNRNGKQIGYFDKLSNRGSWIILTEDMNKLKEILNKEE
jgi:Holliday junction resolvasome RuvABC DNA-binding subunit